MALQRKLDGELGGLRQTWRSEGWKTTTVPKTAQDRPGLALKTLILQDGVILNLQPYRISGGHTCNPSLYPEF